MRQGPIHTFDSPLTLEFRSVDMGTAELVRITDANDVLIEWALEVFLALDSSQIGEIAVRVGKVSVGYVRLTTLDFLRNFHRVEDVKIQGVSIIDISGLSSLPKLNRLEIDGRVRNMSVLGELTSLTSLYLSDWKLGADSIFALRKLKNVTLCKFPYVSLEKCAQWLQLEELWINSGKLESIRGIPKSVRHLRLSDLTNFISINDLVNCPNLERLQIEICRRFQSLDGLESASRLKTLSVSRTGRLESLESLQGASNLEYCFLADGTKISPQNVDSIYKLHRLKTLIIDQTAQIDTDRVQHAAPNCIVRVTRR